MTVEKIELLEIKNNPEKRVVNYRLSGQKLWLNYLLAFPAFGSIWFAIRQNKWNYFYVMGGTQAIALVLMLATDNIAIKRHSRTVARLATAVYCIPRIKKSKEDALKIEQQLKELDVTA